MELKEFVRYFADQFEDTDPMVFTPGTKFRSIEEWSSLGALSIIAMVDEKYNIRLTGDDIRRSSTIEDLFNIVKAKK